MTKRYSILVLAVLLLSALIFPTTILAKKDASVYLDGYTLKANQSVNLPYGQTKFNYNKGEMGSYVIMFAGPIEEPMKIQAEVLGARLVDYLPDFAFLTLMTPEVAEKVKALDCVADVQIYQPAYKIQASLKDEKGSVLGAGDIKVNVVTFNEDASVIENDIRNLNGTKVSGQGGKVTLKINRNKLVDLAQLDAVKYIEEAPVYHLNNDVAKAIMDVDDIWTLGYDGTGQVVAVCDTGLDTGKNDTTMHLDFQGRIDAIYALGRTTADDPNGHGTHVAGSVLGSGARSNGQIKGMAPGAHLVMQSVLDSAGGLGGLPTDLNTLFTQAYNAGARIHSNSWGAAVSGAYNTDSRNVDLYVWNNRQMTILFAAGNEGLNKAGTKLVYTSIDSPGSAKNCITVGASENNRVDKGTYGDNINQVAYFSSKGWTADGRVKPDICAPGTWILSTRSTLAPDANFWGTYNSYYSFNGGTSMATPLTSGAVAVARQYIQSNWLITPTPALLKAILINGAVNMGTYGIPSKDQGWGRVSLVNSLTANEFKYDNETVSLATGQTKVYSYAVASTAKPLRICLVWSDYPGTVGAAKALVNDLDIVVTSPTGKVFNGNDFTSPYNDTTDRLNNVENVFIGTPEVGTYTITVKGYNVPNGPQPFALFTTGDFQ